MGVGMGGSTGRSTEMATVWIMRQFMRLSTTPLRKMNM